MLLLFWRPKAPCTPAWTDSEVPAGSPFLWTDSELPTTGEGEDPSAGSPFFGGGGEEGIEWQDVDEAQTEWEDAETPKPTCA